MAICCCPCLVLPVSPWYVAGMTWHSVQGTVLSCPVAAAKDGSKFRPDTVTAYGIVVIQDPFL